MNTRRTQRSSSPRRSSLHSPSSLRQEQAVMASEPAQNGTAAVSVFAPIAAPVLRSVDPVQVASFLKERERYELEILSKQADLPNLKALPYTASIDRTLLKSLFFMGNSTISPKASHLRPASTTSISRLMSSPLSAAATKLLTMWLSRKSSRT